MNQAYEIYILTCDNIDSSIVKKFIQHLSPERQIKAMNYRQEADTVRTVRGEMLLRYALSQKKVRPYHTPTINLSIIRTVNHFCRIILMCYLIYHIPEPR
jgi:hypothetical protein